MKPVPSTVPIQSQSTTPASALRQILVATDFSDNANLALNWAIELAKAHRARITLVHAIDPRHVNQSKTHDDHHESVKRNLDQVEKLVRTWQLNAVVEHEIGRPWEVIGRVSEKLKPDLIVLGTGGHHTLGRRLLGGTADRVIRLSSVPVLIVHPDDDQIGRGFRRILVPIDFSEESILATHAAVRLLATTTQAPGKLVLLHVCELELPAPGSGFSPAHFDSEYWNNQERDALRQLNELANSLRGNDVTVETATSRGLVSMAILDQATAAGADLIAMGTQGRSGLRRFWIGSVAERVLNGARCPVLVTRSPAAAA